MSFSSNNSIHSSDVASSNAFFQNDHDANSVSSSTTPETIFNEAVKDNVTTGSNGYDDKDTLKSRTEFLKDCSKKLDEERLKRHPGLFITRNRIPHDADSNDYEQVIDGYNVYYQRKDDLALSEKELEVDEVGSDSSYEEMTGAAHPEQEHDPVNDEEQNQPEVGSGRSYAMMAGAALVAGVGVGIAVVGRHMAGVAGGLSNLGVISYAAAQMR